MNPSTFVITGADGQLGRALRQKYPDAQALTSDDLDIGNEQAIKNFDWSDVTTILNVAGYTNVDGAETDEGKIQAEKVNSQGVQNLAEVAKAHDITLVHISTDYVFDGRTSPHTEVEPFSPLSVYGRTKAEGDKAVQLVSKYYILRTSWVIGEGKNFVRTMLELGQKGINPSVVSDQIGRLTFTSELVLAIDHLLSTGAPFGTYNLTNDGEPVSWSDITRKIFELAGFKNSVTDVTTKEYYEGKENIAPRPLQSTLDLTKIKATGFVPRDWQEDLAEYISNELRTTHVDAEQGANEK